MARRPFIAGNWKMNNTIGEAVVLTQEISNNFEPDWSDKVDVAICPPYVDLKPALTVLEFDKLKIAVGAQNCFYEEKGAYTGEISVPMLAEIGCKYCIVGHSERRLIFGETNEDVNLKAKALLQGHIHPIICCGESLAVRDDNNYIEFVTKQIIAAFAGISQDEAKECVIAYEPIWAIGTGRTATPEQAEEVCGAIRQTVADLYGGDIAESMRILYGGSMNEGNAEQLLSQDDIDGGLIGGASLKAKSFVAIIEAAL